MPSIAEHRAKNDTESMLKPDPTGSEESPHISLVSIEKEGLVKLASNGAVTATCFNPNGRNPMERVLGQNWATMRVMIDMRKTTYLDSSAIGWLIATHKAFNEAGGKLVIHDLPATVRPIFDLLQVGRVITIAENAEQAKTLVLGGGK